MYGSAVPKQKFAIGGELDLIGTGDLKEASGQIIRAMIGLATPPTTIRPTAQFSADASGAILAGEGEDIVYICPVGARVKIHRWLLEAAGFTPVAPLNVGYLYARRGGSTGDPVLFWPGQGATVAPSLWTDGDSAVYLRSGERLVITGAGFAPNQSFLLHLQIDLWEAPARVQGQYREEV